MLENKSALPLSQITHNGESPAKNGTNNKLVHPEIKTTQNGNALGVSPARSIKLVSANDNNKNQGHENEDESPKAALIQNENLLNVNNGGHDTISPSPVPDSLTVSNTGN